MSEIWCGIPVYNNAGTIADVVSRCRRQIADVVVIDDGSTDADLRELLKPLDVPVIRHPQNLGKGKALMTAFDYAAVRGAKYFITLDGDGQHFPEDIPQFISRLDPDTILIGSRQRVIGKMPYSSRFGREFSDFWVCVESGAVVSDTQSGFRAYPLPSIERLSSAFAALQSGSGSRYAGGVGGVEDRQRADPRRVPGRSESSLKLSTVRG